jgi:Tfp pilus assembly protein FimV
VQPGDTLWEIASEISDEDVDVRVVIAEIKRLNDLDTSSLRSGQSLLIPAT